MGKNLNGKELGKGISQRKDGRYVARFMSRSGNRKELKDTNSARLKRRFKKAKDEDVLIKKTDIVKQEYTINKWYDIWFKNIKCK